MICIPCWVIFSWLVFESFWVLTSFEPVRLALILDSIKSASEVSLLFLYPFCSYVVQSTSKYTYGKRRNYLFPFKMLADQYFSWKAYPTYSYDFTWHSSSSRFHLMSSLQLHRPFSVEQYRFMSISKHVWCSEQASFSGLKLELRLRFQLLKLIVNRLRCTLYWIWL